MPINRLKRALSDGPPQIGLWSTLTSPIAAEVVAGSGFDWVRLDTEHAPSDVTSVWDTALAARLADRPLDLLSYRSSLLGADLRITNVGGGNTSSKIDVPDPLTGRPVRVLAVKGSGGGLDLDKLQSLVSRYRGEAHEDEMVGFYPLRRRRQSCGRIDRHAASRAAAVSARRSSAS